MNKPVLLTIIVLRTTETAKAHGLDIDGFERTVWLPKSQIQDFKDNGESVSFWCMEWLVKEKRLQEFIDTSYEPSLFD